MPSNFTAFDVMTEDAAGVKTILPLTTVNVRDVVGEEDLDDLTTDADGHVPAGSVDVAAGSLVRFSVELGDGQKGYAEQVTT